MKQKLDFKSDNLNDYMYQNKKGGPTLTSNWMEYMPFYLSKITISNRQIIFIIRSNLMLICISGDEWCIFFKIKHRLSVGQRHNIEIWLKIISK